MDPNDSRLYEQIMTQVQETSEENQHRTIQPLLQTGIGATAGLAVGFFLLPTTSLLACGIIGGLGLYSLSNLIQSIRIKFSQDEPLTIPVLLSKQKD